ncbi:MAG: reverse transcriptase domain-containing protein [bacterium]|nr:reverse transcriptase domain-containing protein [bacterium]
MRQLDLGLETSDAHRLYEEVCTKRTLERAFKKVKANQGAPGPDGESIEEFEADLEARLDQLRKELESWSYQPSPVRRVVIPKPGGGERLLGIANVRDRIVYQAIAMVMGPLFEPGFSDHCYGYRPGRSQRDAVAEAQKHVGEGKQWVVDLDLERFFDTVNHDRVHHLLRDKVKDRRMIRLVAMILRSGIWIDGKVERSREGLHQGSPLSPLLSNIVLHELDEELEKRGLDFVRYADDCNIFVCSRKAAERVMDKRTRFIEEKLKLWMGGILRDERVSESAAGHRGTDPSAIPVAVHQEPQTQETPREKAGEVRRSPSNRLSRGLHAQSWTLAPGAHLWGGTGVVRKVVRSPRSPDVLR